MKLFLLAAFFVGTSFASLYFKDPTIYYHDNQWYYFSQTRATQPQAESFCLHSGTGGHLSSAPTLDENNWIFNTHAQFSNNEHSPLWIGAVRNLTGNQHKPFDWVFIDGQSTNDVILDVWFQAKVEQRNEPNNLRGDEYCVAQVAPYLNQNASWKDDQCARAYKFVCKYQFGTWFTAPWTVVDASTDFKYITAVASYNSTSSDYIYTSSDFGTTWVKHTDLPGSWSSVSVSWDGKYQTAVDGNNGFIWISHDNGVTFAKSNAAAGNWVSVSLSQSGEYQTAAVQEGDLYYSLDFGLNWELPDTSVTSNWWAVANSFDGRYQIATSADDGTNPGLIATSNDWGDTWTTVVSNTGSLFYAAASSGDGKYQTAIDGQTSGQIWKSDNFGQTFTAAGTGASYSAVSISSSGQYQTVGVWDGGLLWSNDFGATWHPSDAPTGGWYWIQVSTNGQYQAATDAKDTSSYVWLSSDWGHTWTHGTAN